jgi:hypothetical protein
MKHRVRSMAAAAAIAASSLFGSVASAQTYQVDCAILLCLAGGWPPSAACADARAVFIHRITPWPIEPPLQIWNCPMGATFTAPARLSPMERFYDIVLREEPGLSVQQDPHPLVHAQSEEQADIDISGDAFDFVRSIRVFHIEVRQRVNGKGDCVMSDSTRLGSYGLQGDYRWTRSSVSEVPAASALPDTGNCRRLRYRSVFVDWRDHEGNYGFEEVRY